MQVFSAERAVAAQDKMQCGYTGLEQHTLNDPASLRVVGQHRAVQRGPARPVLQPSIRAAVEEQPRDLLQAFLCGHVQRGVPGRLGLYIWVGAAVQEDLPKATVVSEQGNDAQGLKSTQRKKGTVLEQESLHFLDVLLPHGRKALF